MQGVQQQETEHKKGSPVRMFIGLGLALVLAIVCWVVAPSVIPNLTRGSSISLTSDQLRLFMTAGSFVLGLVVVALLMAFVTPRDSRNVNEAKLAEEREALRQKQKMERLRAARKS
ncbi:MAG: hypothetical protein R3E39_31640 [Anaerolineae bacterium]